VKKVQKMQLFIMKGFVVISYILHYKKARRSFNSYPTRGKEYMNTIFTAKHLKAFLNGILDMAFLMKVEKDRFIYSMLNSSAQKATGFTENIVGKALEDVLPPEIACRLTDKYRMVAVTKQALTYEDINLLSQERFPVETTLTPICDEAGECDYILAITKDITERKYIEELYRREEKLKYMAYHDNLTGLPNRRMFYKILKEEVDKAKRYGHHFAVLYLDCDDFKNINDTLGHDGGDAFLKHFADTLTTCVRADDVVARIGGDEFVILLSKMNTEKEGAEVASRILDALKKPQEINGCKLTATSSIGISLYRGGEMSGDELLKQADQALYQAKAQGRNCYAFFAEK
jgi:diguanylate cyclase (GGDEF)-like protein/PAS domain S-box-containing protein